MQFTYAAYAALIGRLRADGYVITDYQRAGQAAKEVLLRHDVDADLAKAVEFARVERSLGVASTYFLLLTGRHYNVFAKQSLEQIDELVALGHKIGLHFDEQNYELPTDALFHSKVAMELETLRNLLNLPIQAVSMHRPSPEALAKDWDFTALGAVNSYSKVLLGSYRYLSDSRMNWREDIEAIVRSGAYPRLQLLTHPFWYGEREQSMQALIKAFCLRGNRERYNCLSENMLDLQAVLSPEALDGKAD